MRCPGQDPRYWTEDSVFDVPCPECGAAVELFKDEASGRCTTCGHRFRNPGVDFGCAQWCSLAEQCLGLVPEQPTASGPGETALAGRLIQEVKNAFEGDSHRLTHSLKMYHYAKEFLAVEGPNPRVVLAAALLLTIAASATSGPATDAARGLHAVEKILRRMEVDDDTIHGVCDIIQSCLAGRDVDCIDYHIVRDADTLAVLTAEGAIDDPESLQQAVEHRLMTRAAKEKARRLFRRS